MWTKLWGSFYWNTLFEMCIIPSKYSQSVWGLHFRNFFECLVQMLPCPICKLHAGVYIEEHALSCCTTQEEAFSYLVSMRNNIRERNNEPTFTICDTREYHTRLIQQKNKLRIEDFYILFFTALVIRQPSEQCVLEKLSCLTTEFINLLPHPVQISDHELIHQVEYNISCEDPFDIICKIFNKTEHILGQPITKHGDIRSKVMSNFTRLRIIQLLQEQLHKSKHIRQKPPDNDHKFEDVLPTKTFKFNHIHIAITIGTLLILYIVLHYIWRRNRIQR